MRRWSRETRKGQDQPDAATAARSRSRMRLHRPEGYRPPGPRAAVL